jgi:UDP-2-acetamido-3-amino-2,3-dideoxy-glucuronate N-acetyltransferase
MSHPFETYPAIAPDATVAPEARIEPGARICSRASIGGQVRLANSVFVGRNVHISGEVSIGPNVHIEDDVEIRGPADIAADLGIGRETSIGAHRAPGATVGPGAPGTAEPAQTRIGERALIGKGCVLEAGICLGEFSFVRQRAHLYGDLPAHGMAYGDPAVLHNFLCSCGAVLLLKQRSGIILTLTCPRCATELRITATEMQKNGHILLPDGQVGAQLSLGFLPAFWDFGANLE